jgi:hypothetical protein
MTPAYWISPKGELIKVVESHIMTVITYASKFGCDEKQIRETYHRYKEKYGTEGKAREKIICELVGKGWIRVRRYSRPERWSFTVGKLNKQSRCLLRKFAKRVLGKGIDCFVENDRHTPAVIFAVVNGKTSDNVTISDIGKGCLWPQGEKCSCKLKVLEKII